MTLPTPTRDDFIRHAERFGPECVAETAALHGVDLGDALLEAELRRERKAIKRRYAEAPTLRAAKLKTAGRRSRRRLKDIRVREILDGLKTVEDVAEELGVKDATVRGWLAA